jgi:general secretion pathway protein C
VFQHKFMASDHSTTGSIPPRIRAGSPLRWAVRLIELALIAVIAFLAAQAVWFVIYGDAVRPLALQTDAALSAGASQSVTDLSSLSGAGLFAARTGQVAAGPQIAPETRLNLTLRGVRSGANPQSGAAFIEAPGAGQRSFGAGDEIADDVTLEEIYEDRVIINRRGARESLFLTEEAARRARSGASARPAGAVQSATAATQASPLSGAPDLTLARSLDPEDWIEGLRLAPQIENGQVTGFRVRPNSHLEVMRAAGLQPGDLVTVLNGVRLTGPEAASEALALFETRDRLAMTVVRDGGAIEIDVALN